MVDKLNSHKTVFLTKYGLFKRIRKAQELCHTSATFQGVMNLVLCGLAWNKVLLNIDNVIVLGKSFEESLENLAVVLQRFEEHNLKLKPKQMFLVLYRGSFPWMNSFPRGFFHH